MKQWNCKVPASAARRHEPCRPPGNVRSGPTASSSLVVDSGIRSGHAISRPPAAGLRLHQRRCLAALGYPPNWTPPTDGRDADPTDPGDYVNDALLAMLPPDHGLTPARVPASLTCRIIGCPSKTALASPCRLGARILPVRVLRARWRHHLDIVDGIAWAARLSVPVFQRTRPPRVSSPQAWAAGE